MPSWGSLGVLLEHSWRPLGAFFGGLGALLRLFLGDLGGLLGLFGGSGGLLGALLRCLRGLLGPAWTLSLKKKGVLNSCPPPRRLKNAVLGPSWAALGALLGALGAVLGPSWTPLGAILGHLGAILRPQEPIGGERARRQKTLIFFRFLKDFGLLGGSLEASEGT